MPSVKTVTDRKTMKLYKRANSVAIYSELTRFSGTLFIGFLSRAVNKNWRLLRKSKVAELASIDAPPTSIKTLKAISGLNRT